jgi:hypothetical protein
MDKLQNMRMEKSGNLGANSANIKLKNLGIYG